MRRNQSRYDYRRFDEPPVALAIRAGAALALIGVIVMFAGPVGYRLRLVSLPFAFNRLFVSGANIAGAGLIAAAIGLVFTLLKPRGSRRGLGRAVLAIAIGALALRAGGRIPFVSAPPALSDISTDTTHPPEYVALPQARDGGSSAGSSPTVQQGDAYPDIQPVTLMVTKDQAFAQALNAVRRLGWTLIAADGPAGRIEASASSRLFGTVDDVVVRVSEVDGGSRVDVRSVSREMAGGSASRVRAILRALRQS